jgi:hypothetical protein
MRQLRWGGPQKHVLHLLVAVIGRPWLDRPEFEVVSLRRWRHPDGTRSRVGVAAAHLKERSR